MTEKRNRFHAVLCCLLAAGTFFTVAAVSALQGSVFLSITYLVLGWSALVLAAVVVHD